MKYTIQDYLPFLNDKDNFFIDPSNTVDNFNITPPSKEWKIYKDKHWTFLRKLSVKLPTQGWKIHLSAGYDKAELQLMINTACDYLFANNICFKVTNSYEEWLIKNSKSADRVSAGKFITIYPQNETQFKQIVEKLKILLQPYKIGPYILSDKRYQETNIYYRYGGFKEIKNNNGELCIRDQQGNLIPDERLPFYKKPDFVEDPFEKATKDKSNKIVNKDKLDSYNISSALHFSNAGGVYLGQCGERKYVIKEGRKNAGIDSHLQDGFSRIKHEATFLNKLKDSPYVVNIKDYFQVWIHNYLVEDYLPLENLGDYISNKFPVHGDEAHYVEKIKTIAKNLVTAVDDVHERGVALGDLQPDNILINESKNQVLLIDLEQANELMAQYDPGLKTVGFVDSNMVISTYEQADWLATYKTIRYALEPLIDIDSLSTYNEKYRDLNWMKYREEVKKFLQEFKLECFKRGHINHKNDNVPTNPVMLGTLDENITKLKRGIVSNIDDTQSTINGDIEQFLSSTGKINVLNGLMGLGLVEQEKTEPIFRLYTNLYLNSKDQLVQIGSKDNGLFTGAAGIGSLIYNWFDKKIGEQIINNIDATKIHNMSLKSGLAGIGLAKLALYQANKQEEQKVEVQKIASIVTSHYKACQTLGILDGKLGLLLFLEKVGIYFNDSNLIKIVKQEINNFVAVHLSFNDGVYLAGTALGRESYFPYLNSGTAGLALVLLEFMYDEIVSNEIRPLINKLIETLDVNLTYMNGLFDGFGGLMLVDLAAKNYGYPNYLAKKIDLINNYLDIEEDQILVPGPYGLKNSMDLASGAIGMLTVFQGIKENNWGKWIPLVHSTNFSLFEGGI